ncbi:DUF4157 domain-containing protein [Candidatus Parcubacteria bacterium]|nr:MAG: DUF4157 domain-containing protein [Candidatus Parcubacteria bacterium]
MVGWIMSLFDAPPGAVTIGRTIFVPDSRWYASLSTTERSILLAHELTHVRQWQEKGWMSFMAEYVREYIRTRRAGINTHDASRGISLEREAIRVEQETREQLYGDTP